MSNKYMQVYDISIRWVLYNSLPEEIVQRGGVRLTVSVQQILEWIEQLAPFPQRSDERLGLQFGDPDHPVDRVALAWAATVASVEEAAAKRIGLIVTRCPLFNRPVRRLLTDDTPGRLVALLARNDIQLYTMHRTIDYWPDGLSDWIASGLGIKNASPLNGHGGEKLLKLVVFVPEGHEDSVRDAVAAAGAGVIGNYSHCSFQTPGVGTFVPLAGSSPFTGEQEKLERVSELRLEMLVPESRIGTALDALRRSHPYEEVAYDLYVLANRGDSLGPGRVGDLGRSLPGEAFVEELKLRHGWQGVRVWGDTARRVDRAAVLVGERPDGGLMRAAGREAHAVVAGDVASSQALAVAETGCLVIDPGLAQLEAVFVPHLAAWLARKAAETGLEMEVFPLA